MSKNIKWLKRVKFLIFFLTKMGDKNQQFISNALRDFVCIVHVKRVLDTGKYPGHNIDHNISSIECFSCSSILNKFNQHL